MCRITDIKRICHGRPDTRQMQLKIVCRTILRRKNTDVKKEKERHALERFVGVHGASAAAHRQENLWGPSCDDEGFSKLRALTNEPSSCQH